MQFFCWSRRGKVRPRGGARIHKKCFVLICDVLWPVIPESAVSELPAAVITLDRYISANTSQQFNDTHEI
jgi:hypothetical protein